MIKTSMPFFRQPFSTFIKSLHGHPAIIFVANEASISPLFSRPMSNVERKIDIAAFEAEAKIWITYL